MLRWVKQNGVWRQVESSVDMAIVNRDAAVAALKQRPASVVERNMLELIKLQAGFQAGLGLDEIFSKREIL